MAAGGEVYEYLGVVDSLVRENVFSKIAAITGVEYEDVYDLWLHHDASECSRLVFLGDHPIAQSTRTGAKGSMTSSAPPSRHAMTNCSPRRSIEKPNSSIRSCG